MSDNSRINKQSSALADEAASRAVARRHKIVVATAGAETVPDFKDSSSNDIENASPLSAEKREKAKKALLGE